MTACPTADVLELHVAGELTDGAGQSVTTHIETGNTCRQELH